MKHIKNFNVPLNESYFSNEYLAELKLITDQLESFEVKHGYNLSNQTVKQLIELAKSKSFANKQNGK